ncbi:MAG: hypothetical protein QOD53_69 [Thermoleophilaceae bacterium]|jgi:hypothetical protein|nr:hypothetical protein [Thermoleophilaceae bacterium]
MARRLALLLALALPAALAVVPASASALASATRYASPAGTPADPCTASHPCDAHTAVHDAPNGSDVYLYADRGDYQLNGQGVNDNSNGVHVHGLNGRARIIGDGLVTPILLNGGSTVDDVYVEHPGVSDAFSLTSASADNVIVKSSAGASACSLTNSVLTNSVCWASAVTPEGAAHTQGNATLRNVTIEATGGGNSVGLKATAVGTNAAVDLENVIARGAPGGWDIVGHSDGSHTVTVNSAGSNYGSTTADGTTGVSIDAAAQIDLPQFVDAAGGDFHQTCTSKTVNTGVDDAAIPVHDFDGDPRRIAAHTDIGADELTAGPNAGALAPSGVTPTTATLNGAVNPGGCATNWHFDYGVASLDSHTPNQSLTLGSVAKPVSTVVSGLKPATTYRFHLVAASLAGQITTTDSTFKTAPDPFTGVVVKAKKATVKKGKAKIKVTCPAGTPGRCVGTLKLVSAKKLEKKKRKLGRGSFSIAAGKSATVTIKISKRGRAYLKGHMSLAAKATAIAHDGAGTVKTTGGKVKLTRAKKKH